jgi:hypothetical protein
MIFEQKTVTVEAAGTFSSGFTVEYFSLFIGALFPAMDDGDIGLEFSIDNGANYYPIIDPADADDAVLCGSGDDPGWVDFSDWVRFVPHNEQFLLRFTCAAQGAAVDILVMQRG